MTHPFTVFLIRHGERMDEVAKRKGLHVSKALKADPPLTKNGHEQAFEAFQRLLSALEADGTPRKIAVFSSPLRRTVATSLMLAAARNRLKDSCLEFGLRTTCMSRTDSNDTIPIAVLNGLGSCAAYCKKHGGADVLAQAGQINCADMKTNNGSVDSPFVNEIRNMQKICHEIAVLNDDKQPGHLQYFKIDQDSGIMLPLGPPLSNLAIFSESAAVVSKPHPCAFSEHCRPPKHENFTKCIDRAVRIAKEDGCDTLIVVTHREAIYSLVHRWGLNGKRYDGHPYCCIAVFEAVLPHGHERCEWSFEGVTPYERFNEGFIPCRTRAISRSCQDSGITH